MENLNINQLLGEATQHVTEAKSVHFIRETWPPNGYVGKIDVPADMPNEKALGKALDAFNGMDDKVQYQGPSAGIGDVFVIEQGGNFQAHKILPREIRSVENPRAVAQARYARNLEILKPDEPRSPEEQSRMIKALIENYVHESGVSRDR